MTGAIEPACVGGLTLAVLAARHPEAVACLPDVLADEIAAGRVMCDQHGLHRLVPSAFAPGQVAALASLDDDRAAPLPAEHGPGVDPALADRLTAAITSDGPASGSALAVTIGVRKQAVLAELRSDPRFERAGHGAHTAWRLADLDGSNGNRRNRSGTATRSRNGSDDRNPARGLAERVHEVEQRLRALERELAGREAQR